MKEYHVFWCLLYLGETSGGDLAWYYCHISNSLMTAVSAVSFLIHGRSTTVGCCWCISRHRIHQAESSSTQPTYTTSKGAVSHSREWREVLDHIMQWHVHAYWSQECHLVTDSTSSMYGPRTWMGVQLKKTSLGGYSGTKDFRSNLPLVTSLIVPPVDITQVPSHIGLQGTSAP